MSESTCSHGLSSPEIEGLLNRVSGGDTEALSQILDSQRDYLRRLLNVRMDEELRTRIDPSDVIQETHIVVTRRIKDFLRRRPTSFKLWLRGEAIQQLIDLRRKHVLAAKRPVRQEVSLPEASSLALAHSVLSQRPSTAMRREELIQQTNKAMELLSEDDREVLLLRHIEELTNAEVAEVLDLAPDTASKRYGRAILRLRAKLVDAEV